MYSDPFFLKKMLIQKKKIITHFFNYLSIELIASKLDSSTKRKRVYNIYHGLKFDNSWSNVEDLISCLKNDKESYNN